MRALVLSWNLNTLKTTWSMVLAGQVTGVYCCRSGCLLYHPSDLFPHALKMVLFNSPPQKRKPIEIFSPFCFSFRREILTKNLIHSLIHQTVPGRQAGELMGLAFEQLCCSSWSNRRMLHTWECIGEGHPDPESPREPLEAKASTLSIGPCTRSTKSTRWINGEKGSGMSRMKSWRQGHASGHGKPGRLSPRVWLYLFF